MGAELDEQSVISASSQFWEQFLAIKLKPVPMAEIFCIGTRHLLGSVDLFGAYGRAASKSSLGPAVTLRPI